MDPVQALILKLMESRGLQDRNAMNPTSDPGMQGLPPGGAQAPTTNPNAALEDQMYGSGAQTPDDLIAQMLQQQAGPLPQR